MRNLILCLIVAALGATWTTAASAQGYFPGGGYNPGGSPAFSPYLNLLRQGGSPVQNYFGLVKPQLNFMDAVQQLDQQQGMLGAEQNNLAITANSRFLPGTGHVSRFQTQNRYFMTNGSRGMGMMGGGGGMMGGRGMMGGGGMGMMGGGGGGGMMGGGGMGMMGGGGMGMMGGGGMGMMGGGGMGMMGGTPR